MYEFHKWYFDGRTSSGELLLFYVAAVRALTTNAGELGVTLCKEGTAPSATHCHVLHPIGDPSAAGIVTREGTIAIDGSRVRVKMSAGATAIDLHMQGDAGWKKAPLVIHGPLGGEIRWYPLLPRVAVSGELELDGRPVRFNGGTGYSDYVFSNVLPPLVPIRELVWGRLHHQEVDLSFTVARDGGRERQWGRLIARFSGSVRLYEDVMLLPQTPPAWPAEGAAYVLEARDRSTQLSLAVLRGPSAVVSDFLDAGPSRKKLLRRVLRTVARSPRGTKYFSRASVRIMARGSEVRYDGVPMFEESVFLGR